MISRIVRSLTLAVAALVIQPLATHAGWLIVNDGGDQTLVSRGRLAMLPGKSDGTSMAIDLGRGRMWLADAGRRVYWEGPVEEFCTAVRTATAGMLKQMDGMADALKDMPAAQREQVLQMMKQMGRTPDAAPARKAAVTVERTTEMETIAGLPARKYRVLADGRLYEELWITNDAALVRELDLGRAPDTLGRMFACHVGAGRGIGVEESPEYRALYGAGWPLRAVYHGDGGASGRSSVVRVERRDVAERELAPPAGFRAAPIDEVFGVRER
ncbi:MAG TPA: hypothetical protein VGU22_07320 [Methylomirabilota bacterium]|jgi:hypothetical protein|nr:hypothetical protein [Methylomirabilota bacterium]